MTTNQTDKQPRRSPSRHEDVEIWRDVCCCEAEPRWRELAERMQREQEQEQKRQQEDRQAPR